MSKKVIILDTSILNVWLQVPGRETCNEWDYPKVNSYIQTAIHAGASLILPVTSVIETGNFIANNHGDKRHAADAFTDMIIKAAQGTTPWVKFDAQTKLWEKDQLIDLATHWHSTVLSEQQSLGDAAIVEVARYWASTPGIEVEIFTGDGGLKNYEYKLAGQPLRRNRHPSH